MIDWFIDTFLGVWGRHAVDFYGTYALPINSVIVLYGAVLLCGNRRLRPYREAAVKQAGGIIGGGRVTVGPKLQEQVSRRMDWERVAAVGPGRLVVGRWRLWPTRASAASLPRLLPVSELVRDAQQR